MNAIKQTPTWLYVAGVIVLAFGLFLIIPDRNVCSTKQSPVELEQKCVITYPGVDGHNALDLLKATHQVGTQKFSFGEMVNSIDGVKAPATDFWAFYVNGQLANVGAGDYQTKSTDLITWQLQKIN